MEIAVSRKHSSLVTLQNKKAVSLQADLQGVRTGKDSSLLEIDRDSGDGHTVANLPWVRATVQRAGWHAWTGRSWGLRRECGTRLLEPVRIRIRKVMRNGVEKSFRSSQAR